MEAKREKVFKENAQMIKMRGELQHNINVRAVAQEVKNCSEKGKKASIYHGSTNSTRALHFKKGEMIDVSALNHILKIDVANKYVSVEPNVPMDVLVKATLAHHLIPPVVMELPGITVGGDIQGGAGESSTFKYGSFHSCCEEYDIVLGNGTVITASAKKNKKIFRNIPCSYGSLGIIVRAKMRLIESKRYVHLAYHRVQSFEEAVQVIKNKIRENPDFIDSIMFERNFGVVMIGRLTNEEMLPTARFRRAHDEWFYIRAQKIAKKNKVWEENIPIVDYLFRYNRGAFWVGRDAFKAIHIPFNRLTRFIFHKGCTTRMLYRGLHAANISQEFVIQDLALPQEKTVHFLQWTDKKIGNYPLWLCPLKPERACLFSPVALDTNLIIDVGMWCGKRYDFSEFKKINKDIETKVKQLKGRKVLYAHSYYTQKEFWNIYDEKEYNALREKYHAAKIFPNIYEKITVQKRYKTSILKGFVKFLWSPFNLPIEK